MSTMSLARRRMDIKSLTNPAPSDDDWRRSLPAESGLRASLTCSSPPRKVVWDSAPSDPLRNVDEDYDRADDESHAVEVVPGECDDPEHGSDGADNESSRSASVTHSYTRTRSPSSSPATSPKHTSLPALPGRWAWPRIANPHPSLLTAAQAVCADPCAGPVRPRREASVRQTHAAPPVVLSAQRTRTAAPVPVEGLTKKSRGRRVPTANSAVSDGDIVFQAGKDGEKMTRMFACTVSLLLRFDHVV
jgi:hypothetical protein